MSDMISFEHFDPELELCNLDANGRPIRPRKKPGRKPNPPSPAQRKAQNRAAQRAFRERKRREMREAEVTVKKCLMARDQAIRESRRLQRRVDELTLETNYLKGYALTLKMACIANQVPVPKFWDTGMTDEIGHDELTFSKTKGVPQQLEFFLDKNMNIINIDNHLQLQKKKVLEEQEEETLPSSILTQSEDSAFLMDNAGSPLSSSTDSGYTTINEDTSSGIGDFDMNNALSTIAPQLASHLETPFFQQLLNTDLVGTNPICTTNNASNRHGSFSSVVSKSSLLINTTEMEDQEQDGGRVTLGEGGELPPPQIDEKEVLEEPIIDGKTGLPRTTTEFNPQLHTSNSDDNSSTKSGSTSNSSDKKVFPPMTPLDAINQMRAVKNLDSSTRALFIPTELQRSIRHDTRIDVVPGAALRDHMILFQDFYDANELFDYLADSSVFLGGELGNPDSWFVPPNFFKKYWFLCPNHKHDRTDNAVEIMVNLGQKMIQLMATRKQMYIEREHYQEFFPQVVLEEEEQKRVDEAFLQKDDQQHINDMVKNLFDMEQQDEDDDGMEDLLTTNASDIPLDHFMIMMNNATYA